MVSREWGMMSGEWGMVGGEWGMVNAKCVRLPPSKIVGEWGMRMEYYRALWGFKSITFYAFLMFLKKFDVKNHIYENFFS